ncbi:MAG: NTP transferase domain-containing protein [Fibrobacterota bacterium]
MNILALILAGGKGSRIRSYLSPDEEIKPMLHVGKRRLIEIRLDSLAGIGDLERAVLTFDSPQYRRMNDLVKAHNVPVISQSARQGRLPTMLELPYLLLMQYHFSRYRRYLQSFDALMTLPCDLVFHEPVIPEFVRHYQKMEEKYPGRRRLSLLSRQPREHERAEDFFLGPDNRILSFKRHGGQTRPGACPAHQSGVYIFSRRFLRNPLPFLFGPRRIHADLFLTESDWDDYGDPRQVRALKNRF